MSESLQQFTSAYLNPAHTGQRDRRSALSSRLSSQLVLAGLVTGWSLALASGLAILYDYEFHPGAAAAPPRSWPAASRLRLPAQQSSLLMFVHPHCPCTRASIGELERLLPALADSVSVRIVVFSPIDATPGWHRSTLWDACRQLPGVEVVLDRNSSETERFGVTTSGHVLLYDDSGALQFSGGLTASRGHAGPALGQSQLVARLQPGERSVLSGVVSNVEPDRCLSFGCEFRSAADSPAAQE